MSLQQILLDRLQSTCNKFIGSTFTPTTVEEIKENLKHQVEIMAKAINKQLKSPRDIVWLPDKTSGELIPCRRPIEVVHEGDMKFTFSCQIISDQEMLRLFSVEELLTSSSEFLRGVGKRLLSVRVGIKADFVVSKDGVEFLGEDE